MRWPIRIRAGRGQEVDIDARGIGPIVAFVVLPAKYAHVAGREPWVVLAAEANRASVVHARVCLAFHGNVGNVPRASL